MKNIKLIFIISTFCLTLILACCGIVYLCEIFINKQFLTDKKTIISVWQNGYYSGQNSALRGKFDNFKSDSLEFEKLLITQ